MAKKTIIEDNVSPEVSFESTIDVPVKKDPLADKVKQLKDRGFDANKIAAHLMIAKSKVKHFTLTYNGITIQHNIPAYS